MLFLILSAIFRLKTKPIVYDIGMNNGDDTEYYLAKGYRVVAIEANSTLCANAYSRFWRECLFGNLLIVYVGIGEKEGAQTFYVHRSNNVLSTFAKVGERPGYSGSLPEEDFYKKRVKVKRLSSIINKFGSPLYVKIDIEGYDLQCLQDLNDCNIVPKYISAEAHQFAILDEIKKMGYVKFKCVNGRDVPNVYGNHVISTNKATTMVFDFKEHSAGPFGEDINGDWMTFAEALEIWKQKNSEDWMDIHAKIGS